MCCNLRDRCLLSPNDKPVTAISQSGLIYTLGIRLMVESDFCWTARSLGLKPDKPWFDDVIWSSDSEPLIRKFRSGSDRLRRLHRCWWRMLETKCWRRNVGFGYFGQQHPDVTNITVAVWDGQQLHLEGFMLYCTYAPSIKADNRSASFITMRNNVQEYRLSWYSSSSSCHRWPFFLF